MSLDSKALFCEDLVWNGKSISQFSLVIFKVKKLKEKQKDRDLIKIDHTIPYYVRFQESPVFKLRIIYYLD